MNPINGRNFIFFNGWMNFRIFRGLGIRELEENDLKMRKA